MALTYGNGIIQKVVNNNNWKTNITYASPHLKFAIQLWECRDVRLFLLYVPPYCKWKND